MLAIVINDGHIITAANVLATKFEAFQNSMVSHHNTHKQIQDKWHKIANAARQTQTNNKMAATHNQLQATHCKRGGLIFKTNLVRCRTLR